MAEDFADAVARQVRAYNERDLDGFLACFAEEVAIEDADGQTRLTGRESMREQYGQVLTDFPDIKYEIVTRIRVGSYVVDEEHVTGGPSGDIRAIAIYRLDSGGHIDRLRFLR
jgi:hypothetical protein